MFEVKDPGSESGLIDSLIYEQTYAEEVLLAPAELARQLGDAVVVDVSDPRDFQTLHIPGALNIPAFWNYRSCEADGGLEHMRQAFIGELGAHGIDGSRKIVFTEQSPALGFGRSCRAFYMAGHAGFALEEMRILDGGNHQWKQLGLPLAHGQVCSTPAAAFAAHPGIRRTRFLSISETLAALYRGARFLDVRNALEFFGVAGAPYVILEGQPPCEVILEPGRIPGAIGLPWTDVFERDRNRMGMFKPRTELHRLFAAAGLSPGEETVVYCFKGARASAVLLALHLAGFHLAKMYFAGWNEWSRQASLPKEGGMPGRAQLAGSFAEDLLNERS